MFAVKVLAGLAAAAVIVFAVSPSHAGESDRCKPSAANQIARWTLPRTTEALQDSQPLRVVAIGSSSTQGWGASAPVFSYPAQLTHMLRTKFPRSDITVLNMGIGGEKTDAMLARFDRDVFPWDPDLVIWQTGTNDPMKNMPAARFEQLLSEGVQTLKAAGIDVVLMMPQYSPSFVASKNYARYLDVMRTVATQENVALFDRFTLSRAWFYDKRFAGTPVVSADGLHESDAGYQCVASNLTDAISEMATRPMRTADTPMARSETAALLGRN